MKKIALIFLIAATTVGCSEKNQEAALAVPDTFEVTVADSTKLMTAPSDTSTYGLLGCGYDATGFFFHALSGRSKVIDVERFIKQNPGRLSVNYSKSHYSHVLLGMTASELVEALSQESDDGVVLSTDQSRNNRFCGQLTAAFDQATLNSDESNFSMYQEYVQDRAFSLNIVADSLKNYLTDGFRNDLENDGPEQLLEKYGTHILKAVTLGGKIQVLYKCEIVSGDKQLLASMGLTKAVQLMKGNSMYWIQTSRVAVNQHQEVYFCTTGGSRQHPWHGTVTLDTLTAPIVQIKPWLNSVESKLSLVYVPAGCMVPIYELVADPTKKAALRTAFDAYFENSRSNLNRP
jgi:hypothetical protein